MESVGEGRLGVLDKVEVEDNNEGEVGKAGGEAREGLR